MTTTCPTCGLCYAEELSADTRLHTRLHKQWLEATPTWGINPMYGREVYESDKATYRDIFNSYGETERPLHERVDAAISYLHVQWKERGLWGSIRYNEYARFLEKYPAIHIWIQENYHRFRHEFTNDVQVSICRRYNIDSLVSLD